MTKDIFPDEISHLQEILVKLKVAKEALDKRIGGYDDEYRELKKYMYEYRNEMDAMEMFSNQRILKDIDQTGVMVVQQKDRIEKLIQSPYFGRIDFVYEDEDEAEPFYVGKFSFTDTDNNILIYDWRAPVSSMYYDYELGKASYESLMGTIYGSITRKRQYKIKNSEFEYAIESSMNIHDDILQRELSTTSDDRMKTIIATIQKEQNQIVRNESADTLVIQGVAGSGKTSIALHRVAYLLYKYKDTLTANRVTILSPNRVFADYISNVLPELGEEPIRESSFDVIAEDVLPKNIKFQPSYEQTARIIKEPTSNYAKRAKLKSSLDFFQQLNGYFEHLNEHIFKAKDLTINETQFTQEYLKKRFNAYKKIPVKRRIEAVAADILEVIRARKGNDVKLPSRNEVAKRITKLLAFQDALSLYQGFYESIEANNKFVWHRKNTLEYSDVFPLIYCIQFFEGIDSFDLVDHLVIDEMQDYTPVQYAVLNKLFKCNKTILGDFGQSLNPFSLSSDTSFKNIFNKMEYVELKKSYRSSYEIIEFAKQFLPSNSIEAVERHGETPKLISYQKNKEQIHQIKQILSSFEEKSFSTLGIICKTEEQVEELYMEIKKSFDLNKLDFFSDSFKEGITITTIQLAKGLEFDEVIIPFANEESYSTDFDKGLLYVAVTRAMHQLTVLYEENNRTKLITQ